MHNLHQIKVIPIGSTLYPKSLELVDNPLKILFAKGNLDLLQQKQCVSIVESRSATQFGLKVTEKITAHFTKKDYVIVSGLAEGIDSVAPTSCLANNGSTIAVLAHGLHKIYPSNNRSLGNYILEKRGFLVTERSLGIKPKKHFFALRYRMQLENSGY